MKHIGIWEIITNASFEVQFVLFVLFVFSVLSWAIIFFKWSRIQRATRNAERFLEIFWSGKSMDSIYAEAKRLSSSPVAKIFQGGYLELQKLMDKERKKGEAPLLNSAPEVALENLERALNRAHRSETLKLERSLSFLATTASTTPFIGLFGTVLGIMNSFANIGTTGGASIATVAPGISEALFATAVGLAAAIPAVMGYNYFQHQVRGHRVQMENFSGDFLNIVKRNFHPQSS